eukprot:m.20301 g.20301  ORF g.20301 m.20301 type:complete len:210 (+) comp11026_c0_seq3:4031-4660(+)
MESMKSILLPAKRVLAKPCTLLGECNPVTLSFDRKRFDRLKPVRRLKQLTPLSTEGQQNEAIRRTLGSTYEAHQPPNAIIALGQALLTEPDVGILQNDMLYYLAERSMLKATPKLAEKLANEVFDFTPEDLYLLLELTTYIGQGILAEKYKDKMRRYHSIVVIGHGDKVMRYLRMILHRTSTHPYVAFACQIVLQGRIGSLCCFGMVKP